MLNKYFFVIEIQIIFVDSFQPDIKHTLLSCRQHNDSSKDYSINETTIEKDGQRCINQGNKVSILSDKSSR